MAGDAVILNRGDAGFVEDEGPSGETDIYPGHVLELDDNGDFVKSSVEDGTGRGHVVGLPFDPYLEKGEDVTDGTVGEQLRVFIVGVGGRFDGRLAAGADLTNNGDANVSPGDTLKEVNEGALAAHSSATENTADGPLYMALEAVDNSGAAAGVENQTPIEVVRIA